MDLISVPYEYEIPHSARLTPVGRVLLPPSSVTCFPMTYFPNYLYMNSLIGID
jgi:hypothetical protein